VPAKILIVDAEPIVRNVVAIILRKRGYIVKEAASLGMAISLLEIETPNLVITNGEMPDATAAEAIARMREKCPDLRVLMIPSLPDTGMKDRTVDVGIEVYPKPFRADGLVAKVRAILRGDPGSPTS
jgi:DNA-binding response OmpR family regulator